MELEVERRRAAFLAAISYEAGAPTANLNNPQRAVAEGLGRALRKATRYDTSLSALRIYHRSTETMSAFVDHSLGTVYIAPRGTTTAGDVVFQDVPIATGMPMARLSAFENFIDQVKGSVAKNGEKTTYE